MRPPKVVDSVSSSGRKFKKILQPVEVEASGGDEYRFGLLAYVAIGFMLIANLAENLFHQIFHRDQAGGIAIFVNDDHHMRAFALHLAE